MKKYILFVALLCSACSSLQIDRSYPSDQKVALLQRQSKYETIQIDLVGNKKDENIKAQTLFKLARNKVIDIAASYLKSQSYDIDSIDLDSGTIKAWSQTVPLCREQYIPISKKNLSKTSSSYDCNNGRLSKHRVTIVIGNDSIIDSVNVDFDNRDIVDKLEREKYNITLGLMTMEVKELTKNHEEMYNVIFGAATEFFHKKHCTKFNITFNNDGSILQGICELNNIALTLHRHKSIDIHVSNATNHVLARNIQLKVLTDIMNGAILASLKRSGY